MEGFHRWDKKEGVVSVVWEYTSAERSDGVAFFEGMYTSELVSTLALKMASPEGEPVCVGDKNIH